MSFKKTIKYRDNNVVLNFFKYNDNKIGILMYGEEDNFLYGPATINGDMSKHLKPNEIIVKSCRENIGLYEAFLEQNIVKPKRRDYDHGFDKIPICELHDDILTKLGMI